MHLLHILILIWMFFHCRFSWYTVCTQERSCFQCFTNGICFRVCHGVSFCHTVWDSDSAMVYSSFNYCSVYHIHHFDIYNTGQKPTSSLLFQRMISYFSFYLFIIIVLQFVFMRLPLIWSTFSTYVYVLCYIECCHTGIYMLS